MSLDPEGEPSLTVPLPSGDDGSVDVVDGGEAKDDWLGEMGVLCP